MAYISLETPMGLKIKGWLREVGPRERETLGPNVGAGFARFQMLGGGK